MLILFTYILFGFPACGVQAQGAVDVLLQAAYEGDATVLERVLLSAHLSGTNFSGNVIQRVVVEAVRGRSQTSYHKAGAACHLGRHEEIVRIALSWGYDPCDQRTFATVVGYSQLPSIAALVHSAVDAHCYSVSWLFPYIDGHPAVDLGPPLHVAPPLFTVLTGTSYFSRLAVAQVSAHCQAWRAHFPPPIVVDESLHSIRCADGGIVHVAEVYGFPTLPLPCIDLDCLDGTCETARREATVPCFHPEGTFVSHCCRDPVFSVATQSIDSVVAGCHAPASAVEAILGERLFELLLEPLLRNACPRDSDPDSSRWTEPAGSPTHDCEVSGVSAGVSFSVCCLLDRAAWQGESIFARAATRRKPILQYLCKICDRMHCNCSALEYCSPTHSFAPHRELVMVKAGASGEVPEADLPRWKDALVSRSPVLLQSACVQNPDGQTGRMLRGTAAIDSNITCTTPATRWLRSIPSSAKAFVKKHGRVAVSLAPRPFSQQYGFTQPFDAVIADIFAEDLRQTERRSNVSPTTQSVPQCSSTAIKPSCSSPKDYFFSENVSFALKMFPTAVVHDVDGEQIRPPPWFLPTRQPRMHQFSAGPPGSRTPMHHHGLAVNAALFGWKCWAILPPNAAFTDVHSCNIAAIAASNGVAKHLQYILQGPGDVVILPANWGHAVENAVASACFVLEYAAETELLPHSF